MHEYYLRFQKKRSTPIEIAARDNSFMSRLCTWMRSGPLLFVALLLLSHYANSVVYSWRILGIVRSSVGHRSRGRRRCHSIGEEHRCRRRLCIRQYVVLQVSRINRCAQTLLVRRILSLCMRAVSMLQVTRLRHWRLRRQM